MTPDLEIGTPLLVSDVGLIHSFDLIRLSMVICLCWCCRLGLFFKPGRNTRTARMSVARVRALADFALVILVTEHIVLLYQPDLVRYSRS